MKLTFKKLALLGLAIVAMFVLVGCTDTTTTTTISGDTNTTVGLTDLQKVQDVLDSISLGDVSAITSDLTLPSPTTNGVSVTWSTSDADVINMMGEVSIPTFTEGNATATLTVTVTLNQATLTKTFDVTVLAETAQAFLNRIGTSIIIDSSDSIVTDFELPSTAQGATVTWVSSNTDMVEISATVNEDGLYEVSVTRPKAEDGGVNTSVTLTATLTVGEVSVTVEKSVRIIAEPLAKVYESFETLHSTAIINEYVDLTGVVYAKFKLGYFMTDGDGHYIAIYTTESNASEVAVGDEVRIKGKYAVYNTLYQISSLTFQEVVSTDNDLNVTPVVFDDATDLLDVDSSNRLIHGQVYTITVTPQLRGSYNNVYLFSGSTQVATVYYNATPASIDALEEVVGKVVTIDVVYYTFYSGSSVLTPGVPEVYIIFDGLAEDIELAPLVGQEALDADAANLVLPTTAVGGQSITLASVGGYESAIAWSIKSGSEYASIASGKVTFTNVTASQTVVLTASLTIDGVVDPTTKDFTITVNPITTSTIAQVWEMEKGDVAQVEGTVYFFINNGYFVFDGTGMLFIYTPAPSGTLLGDKLVIFGTVDIYNGQSQIKSATVKEVVSQGNAYEQTSIDYVPGTTELVSGQTYSVTATITELTEGGYTNLFLYDGETRLAQIYYRSTINDSFAALTANKGKEATINVVYYYTYNDLVYFVYQEGAAGIELTPLVGQEALDADAAAIVIPSEVIGGQSVSLPDLGGYGSAIAWTVKTGSEYASIASGKVTFVDVTAVQTVVLTASLTIDGVVDPTTKDFTITVNPITTSTIASVWDMEKGDVAQVEGTVYFFINNGYYVFDGTGMIFIYTTAPSGTLLGDKLLIFGTVDIYNGQSQIKSATVKQVVSQGNEYEQTAIEYVPGTTELVAGQTYAVTATIKIAGSFNNVYLYDGETLLAVIYYRSTINDSYNALKAENNMEATLNLVYYYTGNDSGMSMSLVQFVYQEGAAGIVYTPAQIAQLDVDAIEVSTSVVSGAVEALPASSGTSTIAWAVKDADVNATIADGNVTYATVSTATQVTLVATVTYTPTVGDPIVTTVEYVVTISTYAEKIAEDKAALTVALTANELDVVTLPVEGLNGSAITWVLTATDNATLAVNVLTLDYLGSEYSVTVTATLAFAAAPEVTETKEFTIVVSPVTLVTEFSVFNQKTEGVWSFAGTDMMYIKGIVSALNGTSGTFLQDASGDGIYAHGLKNLAVGDEVIIYTKLGEYNSIRQLNTFTLKATVSTGNTPVVTTMTVAELAAIVPNFYEYGSRLVNVEGIEIKEFRGNYLDMIWASVGEETPVVYMLSFYYNNSTYNWLDDVYQVGQTLPAFNFVFYNIYNVTTFNILPQNLVMTDQQAVDENKELLPESLTLLENYTIPTPVFGATIAISAVSTELDGYFTTDGVVTLGDVDKVGTITFTVTKGSVSDQVTIPVTVKSLTDAQKLALAIADMPATLNLAQDFILEPLLYSGTYGTVTPDATLSTNLSVVSGELIVTRPAGGSQAIVGVLTVNITVGTESGSKDIAVTVLPYATELFISEYIEGSSNNKAVEIYNGTSSAVDLSTYVIEVYSNGAVTTGTPNYSLTLSGTLAAGDVYVVYNSSAIAEIIAVGDISSTITYYNGDDTVVLKNGSVIIDSIGQGNGTDPGTNWANNGVATSEMTLVRISTVLSGDTDPTDAYDPSVQWVAYPQNTVTYLGYHNVGDVSSVVG